MNFNELILEQRIQNLILNILFIRYREVDDDTSNVKKLCINIAKF